MSHLAWILGFSLVFMLGCGGGGWKEGPKPYTGITLVTGNTTRAITDEMIEAVSGALPDFIKLRVVEGDFTGIENAKLRQVDTGFSIYTDSVPDDWYCGLHRSGNGHAYACINEPRSGLWRIGQLALHEAGHGCGIRHTPNTFISGDGNIDSRYDPEDQIVKIKGINYYQWQIDELRECFGS